jgi:hypothetical protein
VRDKHGREEIPPQGDGRENPSRPSPRPEEAASAAVAEFGARVVSERRSHRLRAGFHTRPEYDIAARCSDSRHGCPARKVLEWAHGIDSTRFQKFANQLDSERDQRRAASE